MPSSPKILVPILLLVVAIIIENCAGIVFIKGRWPKPRRKQRASACRFGKRNFTVGQSWNPKLSPHGIDYCISCKCQKSGFTQCARIKCKQFTCPGMMIPHGKCCPVCPGSQTLSQRQCHREGQHYIPGQVWDVPIKKQDRRHNNCAECICYNAKVSCAIRICPALKCLKIFQVKEKDSCCMTCRDLPLQADGETKKSKRIADRPGSCFNNGRYYENRGLWNPITSTTDLKYFQYPNCDICSCENANVTCKKISCPKLKCKKPIQKDSQDCCMSCPGKDSRPMFPIINGSLPLIHLPTDSKASHYPDCEFGEKLYKHNTTWNPLIPELTSSHCLRCTCTLSRVRCERILCKSDGTICSTNCSKTFSSYTTLKPKTKTTDQKDCSRERVQVHLLVKIGGKRAKTKHPSQFNYLVKIALFKTKSSSVEIHHWSVNNNKATVRTSRLKKVRFARRGLSYTILGEAKIGRINRFLNKEKMLAKCNRNCKNKAKDFVNILKNRIRYFKKDCRLTDTFKRLDLS